MHFRKCVVCVTRKSHFWFASFAYKLSACTLSSTTGTTGMGTNKICCKSSLCWCELTDDLWWDRMGSWSVIDLCASVSSLNITTDARTNISIQYEPATIILILLSLVLICLKHDSFESVLRSWVVPSNPLQQWEITRTYVDSCAWVGSSRVFFMRAPWCDIFFFTYLGVAWKAKNLCTFYVMRHQRKKRQKAPTKKLQLQILVSVH